MEFDALSRRSFIAGTGAGAFTIVRPELVRGAADEKLKIGVIGCGGRGTQAAEDTLEGNPNVEIVAMGDVFEDRLERSIRQLREGARNQKNGAADRVKVDAEHRFTGFDAYKKVLASDIDYVILAAPPGYRPEHFEAAVNAKKHVFCEKPFGTDAVGVRRFMDAAKKSEQMKLSVKSGAQRRSQKGYLEALRRVKDGMIGDIVACNAYWVGSPVLQFMSWPTKKRDPKWSDMEFQNRSWYSFVWICGDQIVEQHLHNIDVCNWFMGTHPVKVVASGGAAWRPKEEEYGNIYDHIAADFVYPNGVHMSSYCRQYPGRSAQNVSELLVGTKGRIDTFNNAEFRKLGEGGRNPYVQEHMDLVASILGKGPYVNEGMEVAETTMTCIMGREAAYSGLEITWDMMMKSQQNLYPKAMDMKASVPVTPLPVPGQYQFI